MGLSHDGVTVNGKDAISGAESPNVGHAALVHHSDELSSAFLCVEIVAILLETGEREWTK